MYKNQKHIGLRIFFLAIFLSYFADITFFTHSHIIHGVTIVHSHYFHNNPNSKETSKPVQHSHSESALTLISHANHWTGLVHPTLQFIPVLQDPVFIYFADKVFSKEQTYTTTFHLRGPPMIA